MRFSGAIVLKSQWRGVIASRACLCDQGGKTLDTRPVNQSQVSVPFISHYVGAGDDMMARSSSTRLVG